MSTPTLPQPSPESAESQHESSSRHTVIWLALILIVILLIIGIGSGFHNRQAAAAKLNQSATSVAALNVAVIHPEPAKGSVEIELPGDTEAYTDTPIFARADGYLKRWYVDIGTHVRQGQLIAEIETPELDEQLQQAQATLKRDEANLALAKTTSTRYQNLVKSNAVSRQDTDQAQADEQAKGADVEEAQANVRRLQKLQAFESIYAPFTGTITARNVDVGDLIQAGTGSNPRELFHLASVGRLRIYVAVPQIYSTAVRKEAQAWLTLKEYPGRKFAGTIVRNSGMIDRATRTLKVEVDMENKDGAILPGSFVSVHFAFRNPPDVFTLPANALLFRSEGLNAVLVRNNRAVLSPLTVAHDNGKTVDVSSGVSAEDLVVLNPPDSLVAGQALQPIVVKEK